MEQLPVELRQEILQHIQLNDLKSMRLASKSWAELGQDYLIKPNFVTLPHRNDFQRLLELSDNRALSSRIKSVEFNLGEINEYHARHNIYYIIYMHDPDERAEASSKTWDEYAVLKCLKEEFADKCCNPHLLSSAFEKLSQITGIEVSLAKCPFQHELLQRVWRIPSSRLLARVATVERFRNILQAARPLRLESLSHDRLPFEFFDQKQQILDIISAPFTNLQALTIYSDYSTFPNEFNRYTCFEGLGYCLRSAPNLRTLKLGFQGRWKIDVTLSDFIGDFTWPQLHTLELEGMSLSSEDLLSFLMPHSPTLRRLRLGGQGVVPPHQKANGGIHLSDGTFKSLLSSLQTHLELEKLHMLGDLKDPSREDGWVLRPMYDDYWTPLEDVGGPIGTDLEAFVVRHGMWPMYMDIPL